MIFFIYHEEYSSGIKLLNSIRHRFFLISVCSFLIKSVPLDFVFTFSERSFMKKIYIAKTGTTFPSILKKYGDFDRWTEGSIGKVSLKVVTIDVENGENLPESSQCAGVVITGSHSMVTENLPWSLRMEEWLRNLVKENVPVFGICYGHQLLAKALGGKAGFHAKGKEVGTADINICEEGFSDPLFKDLPETFKAHVTHAQTVLSLPDGAVRLAENDHEPNHAFRVGNCAWGVQFHPEYNTDLINEYIEAQREDIENLGIKMEDVYDSVADTPFSLAVLHNFGKYVEKEENAGL